MRRIAVAAAEAGMVLAKPVLNQTGLTVLTAGTELDADLLRRLERMGLDAVYVEGAAEAPAGTSLADREAQLERRFRQVADDPVQQMIREAVRAHLRRSYAVLPAPETGGAA